MRRIILMIMLITLMLSGCQNENREIKSLDDLKTARIGSWPECGYELKAREVLPNAKFVHLDFLSDLVQNLKQNKIDAFVIGKSYVEILNIFAKGKLSVLKLKLSINSALLTVTTTKLKLKTS